MPSKVLPFSPAQLIEIAAALTDSSPDDFRDEAAPTLTVIQLTNKPCMFVAELIDPNHMYYWVFSNFQELSDPSWPLCCNLLHHWMLEGVVTSYFDEVQ